MKKYFVLDTNVFLYDPGALFRFADNTVVIPLTAIEEMDRFKREISEVGRNARQVSRLLDRLRDKGSLSKGVEINKGGMLRVDLEIEPDTKLPSLLKDGTPDNKILSTAYKLKDKDKGMPVIFITKDTNMRIKADALGIKTEDYERDRVEIEEVYTGVAEVDLEPGEVNRFYSEKKLKIPGLKLHPNQFVIMKDKANPQQSAIGRFQQEENAVLPLVKKLDAVWGISAKNVEQTFALDVLMDDRIKVVTLIGKAGTGKTLLAIAAGLHLVADANAYEKLLISRPIFPLGRDLGFLPGDVDAKLKPWMQPIFDNMDLLMSGAASDGKRRGGKGYDELMKQGMLDIEPLTYIRGRSIPNQFLIVDEAQNLTPHEIKTIVTRVGTSSKIVLTGDPYQIDQPYIDSSNNGLTYIVEKFKNEKIAGHVTLKKGERSELAELAANVL